MRAALALISALALAACAADDPPTEVSGFAVETFALANCSATNGEPFKEISEVQVVVHPGEAETEGATSYDEFMGLGGSSVFAEDVPEGIDEQVTVLGWTGDPNPGYWARRKHWQMIPISTARWFLFSSQTKSMD